MTAAHPLYIPLHARLCGASELLEAGVSAHQMLSLYPLELTYSPFFTDFFEKHPERLTTAVQIFTSYKLLSEVFDLVEKRIAPGFYTDDKISPLVKPLAATIVGNNWSFSYTALRHQLSFFARMMLLLSNWPAAKFEEEEAADVRHHHDFFVGFENILTYYGIRIRFDTEQRRIDTQRSYVPFAQ